MAAPLAGIRVVDLTRVLAGPFCTAHMADMGAEVIKVEEPGHGDESRGWSPRAAGLSRAFVELNRGKRCVVLDLKTPEGADALRRLIARADVLIENFKPGSLAALGFDYEAVKRLNPRLVYCSITGYGQSGPRKDLPGYDPVIQAESGLMDMTGFPDGPPTRIPPAITDYLAGLYALSGILLALRERDRSGEGQQVDIALFDSLLSVLSLQAIRLEMAGLPSSRLGNAHAVLAPYEPLQTADGAVMVAAPSERLWRRLCEAIGAPELVQDPHFATTGDRATHRDRLRGALEARLTAWTSADLVAKLQAAGIPCGQVRTLADALADPQVAARAMRLGGAEPELGGVKAFGTPIKLSRTPARIDLHAHRLGEDTEEVLRELEPREPPEPPEPL
jgi:glutaryl-CoA transferase